MKKYAFFSDLHCGDKTIADNFTGQEVFDKILWYINEGYTVILIGDIVDALQFGYHKILKAYPQLESILKQCILIKGNHDKYLGKELGLQSYDEYVIDDRILVFHGNKYDKPETTFFERIVLKSWAVIERLLGRKIVKELQDTPISPTDPKYKGNKSEYIKQSYNEGIKRKMDMVILGHTHEWFKQNYGDITIINTGCCCYGHLCYFELLIDENNLLGRITVDGIIYA